MANELQADFSRPVSASLQQQIHPGESTRPERPTYPASSERTAPQEPPPHEQLLRMITGYWVSAAIYVAARLGIADLLRSGPRSVEWLAEQTQTHPSSLFRLLRALASVGIFTQVGDGRFQLTTLAQPLRGDVPGSQRALAIMMGEEHFHCYGALLDSVRTGQTAFDKLYGKPIFPFLQDHPDKAVIFDEAMVGIHSRETDAMLRAYDFSGIRRLADIGGGNGSLLCVALQQHPHLMGTLFDQSSVVERARRNIAAAGLASRCQVVGGDFFESIPAGADAYLLRHIIHDWDDEKSLRILRNVRRAMDGGRLLLVENVIPSGNEPCFGKLLDLTMLLLPGGQERTEDEYRRLYQAAGFRLTRIVPTDGGVSVIEGEPA